MIFNCGESLDYKAMAKFFKGLALCGAWSCFDEFDRIKIDVLSVIAQQIQTIQRSISQKLQKIIFDGTEISIDPSCAIFFTMNHFTRGWNESSSNYGGRVADLPDNLKVLFRPVAMVSPDLEMIVQTLLFAAGFVEAKALAEKIVVAYRLCDEQLSSQSHYDFGMRALKATVRSSSTLKLKFPDEDENCLLFKALSDQNIPKVRLI